MPPTLTIDVPGARGGFATVELDPEGHGPDQVLVHVPSGAEGHGVTFAARRVEPGLWDTPIREVRGLDEISPRLAADLGRKVLGTVDAALEVAYPALAEMARERASAAGRTLVSAPTSWTSAHGPTDANCMRKSARCSVIPARSISTGT